MSKIKKIVLSAMLLAILIIFSRFISIKTEILVISFSFVPVMMAAIWLGPKYSTIIAALGDLIGAILFPFGAYFPGFTLSSALSGLVYGVFLYNNGKEMDNKKLLIRLILCSAIDRIIIDMLLGSLWLHILYGKAFMVVLAGRVVKELVSIPIQVVVIYALEKFSRPLYKKYLINEEN